MKQLIGVGVALIGLYLAVYGGEKGGYGDKIFFTKLGAVLTVIFVICVLIYASGLS